jgi:type VI secretion system protein ImpA
MTPTEIAALGAAISPDEPCGPDLEKLEDAGYMGFVTRLDSIMPKSFATFRRESFDFPAEFATLKSLLTRSRDLRLLVLLAKLSILNRDVAAYCAVFKLIEKLVEEAWEPLLPRVEQGGAMLRVSTLQGLDDMPDSVLALQAAPLFETRRFGKFSLRSQLLADGLVRPREAEEGDSGETVPEASAVSTALAEVDIDALVGSRALVVELNASLKRIEELVDQKTGKTGAESLRFTRLGGVVQQIVSILDKSAIARDPSLQLEPGLAAESVAASEEAEAPAEAVAPIGSTAEAHAALAAAAAYFTQSEPSSPVLLVIGQAQALVGLSFFESLKVLLPELSVKARLPLGKAAELTLPMERVAALPLVVAEISGAAGSTIEAPAQSTGSNITTSFSAPDRRTAMGYLQQVAAHFRRAEPSSPIPLLLDRADRMAGKDFVTLLRDALPAGSLSVDG